MRKIFKLFILFVFITGFGFFPDDEAKLPDVTANFSMKVTDREGYTIEIRNVTIGDALYISGRYSKGNLVVKFDEVEKIIFETNEGKFVDASVFLKNHEKLTLRLESNKKLKGKSKYGIYVISLGDVKEITDIKKIEIKKE